MEPNFEGRTVFIVRSLIALLTSIYGMTLQERSDDLKKKCKVICRYCFPQLKVTLTFNLDCHTFLLIKIFDKNSLHE